MGSIRLPGLGLRQPAPRERIDIDAAVRAVRQSRAIAESAPLRDLIVREVRPGPEAVTDDDILAFIRETGETSWHPIGSCRMGAGMECVVDPQLRVHGIRGLRVADASVMPFHPSSNTNAPSIMIGEKAAELILGSNGRPAVDNADSI